MSESSTTRPRTYFGWQNERTNFLFGLTLRRAVLAGGAAVVAVWPVVVSNVALGIVCWPAAALMAAAVFVRVAGRTVDEWAAAAVSFEVGRWRNLHKFASGPFRPQTSDASGVDLPGVLAPLEIYPAPAIGDRPAIAMVRHRLDGTYTAVAKVTYSGIGLADSHRREQRVDGWGGFLAGLCAQDHPIARVQVLHRLVPESGAELRGWHASHAESQAPAAARQVTEGLLATATVATSHRDTYVAVTMDSRRAAGAIKTAGGGSRGAGVVLERQLRALGPSLAAADLHVQQWLGPRDLAEVIRTAYDPASASHVAERRTQAAKTGHEGLEAGVAPQVAGPVAAEATPGSYVHDSAVSATYWVDEWQRQHVHATGLAPLLGEGQHRRSFSFHAEPLPPRAAEREVMKERTSRSVAVRMRQRTGQVIPEHEREALARAEAQDAERAAGHGLVRISAYVTVTVTDPAELDDACAALEADAAAARIEVRRMWMTQDIGFAASALPLGYGMPQKRW